MRKKTSFAVIISSVAMLATAYAPLNVTAGAQLKTIFFVENGKSTTHVTMAETVKDFFAEQDITLTPKDRANMDYDVLLEHGDVLELDRGYYITIVVDGEAERIKVNRGLTVGALIVQLRKEKNTNFTTGASLPSFVEEGMRLELSSFYDIVDLHREPIPFETQEVEAPDLLQGVTELVQEGAEGEKEIAIKISFQKEEEVSRETVAETVVREPVTKIVKVGTKVKAGVLGERVDSISELSYSKALTMTATAYTAGPESTGKRPGMKGYGITASGMKVTHGVVAVDPRVIPLGTKLYVEGYGYSIAADTGSAIKGNKIDLYMESLRAANQFGRRNITVYILN
ncbi:MAG: G5 domain-containing protein [Clostridiales bacterium]|jgi:3D (Asp-Asp-Asp) domain-containing protein|nr:G5 domain-containing protein [Clostridiales bacterium]MDR2749289.1 G5 domain-containing protein [Clostridiales bacterium]